MKTNLIFKRVYDGNIEMVMVPVDIPQLNKGEGWTLASCCDTFTKFEIPTEKITVSGKPLEVLEEVVEVLDTTDKSESKKDEKTPESTDVPVGGKYESQVSGTARLVRYKDKIRITYRKGKTTFNRNEPNSVCIDDITKQQFLKIYNDMDLTRVWVNEDIYKFKMRGEQIIVKSRKVLEPHLIIGEHCPENQDKYLDRIREIRDEIKRSK